MTEQVFLNILGSVLTVVFGALVASIGSYFKEAKNAKQTEAIAHTVTAADTQIQSKRGLAYDAVLFAEDAYTSLGGDAKLAEAIKWAVREGNARGLDITAAGIEGLIRAMYTGLKTKLKEVIPGTQDATETAPEPVATSTDSPATQVQVTAPETVTPVADSSTQPAATDQVKAPEPVATDATVTAPEVATPSADVISAAATAAHDAVVAALGGTQIQTTSVTADSGQPAA